MILKVTERQDGSHLDLAIEAISLRALCLVPYCKSKALDLQILHSSKHCDYDARYITAYCVVCV